MAVTADDEDVGQALVIMQGAAGEMSASHQGGCAAAVSEGDFDDVRGGGGAVGSGATHQLPGVDGA